MQFLNEDDLYNHIYKTKPQYIWLRKNNENKCYKINNVNIVNNQISDICLQNGIWLPPIPLNDRKNMNDSIKKKYKEYQDILLHDGKSFLDSLKNRKDSSEIVAWKSNNTTITISFEDMKKYNLNHILNQQWKCRYCNHINDGGIICKGISKGKMPSGGPKKVNNHVLSEYSYFVSKTFSCQPNIRPFQHETELEWFDPTAIKTYENIVKDKPCHARRCIHYSHINQSDQILSFPRVKWNHTKYIKNTYQYFLPGSMLGHQVTQSEHICSKCKNHVQNCINIQKNSFRYQIEHSWWILEVLYWFKVDIYNKKMQKLNQEQSYKRYQEILKSIHIMFNSNIEDFIYHGKNGFYQTNKFSNILKTLYIWMNDIKNYTNRFNKKKYSKLYLKF